MAPYETITFHGITAWAAAAALPGDRFQPSVVWAPAGATSTNHIVGHQETTISSLGSYGTKVAAIQAAWQWLRDEKNQLAFVLTHPPDTP